MINQAALWNGGGLHHSRDFGLGLVDGTAAVRLAETWTLSQTSANQRDVSAARSTAQAIPDGNLAGLTQTVSIGQAITVEHVSLRLDLTHTWRGQLTVSLISPQGTESVLFDRIGATGSGPGSDLDNLVFTFTSR